MVKSNPKYKDRLFCSIFGSSENKEWLLSIVNAISDSHYTMEDEMVITTLDDVIFIKMKNDVSFLLDNQMFLFEHQSSFCPNMPLRGLLYYAQLYESLLEQNDNVLYSSKLIKIPSPRFFVFYNGNKEVSDRSVLKLSDAFIESGNEAYGNFEWSAIMLNINYGHNSNLLEKCKPLQEYSSYVKMVRDGMNSRLTLSEAVEKAVDYAVDHDFLNGYFKKWRGDVMLKSMVEFDEEKYKKVITEEAREEGLAEGLAEGRSAGLAEGKAEGLAEGRSAGLAEGKAEGLAEGRSAGLAEGKAAGLAEGLVEGEKEARLSIAQNALKMGMSTAQISQLTGLDENEVLKLA